LPKKKKKKKKKKRGGELGKGGRGTREVGRSDGCYICMCINEKER
jgi:hypothetical protein